MAPTPIKRGVQGRSSGGKDYPFRPAAKGVPDCPGIKKVPHPVRAGYGTSLIGWVIGNGCCFISLNAKGITNKIPQP